MSKSRRGNKDYWNLRNTKVKNNKNKGVSLERLEKCCNSLREAIDYLDDVADADMDDSGYVPNEEMRLLSSLRITLMEVTND